MASRDKIEASAKAKLHGVDMPRQLDFSSKKLHHEYVRFKTITKKILTCYDGLEEKHQVDKILMWMGPDACIKHGNHPFPGSTKEEVQPLWDFFDTLCTRQEGTEGSWNAARMKLKFVKQLPEETVDMFYDRVRDTLQQCEYTEPIGKVMEAEALKYGLTNKKVLEKVYVLPKAASAADILNAARAEEAAQRHMREVDRVQREHSAMSTGHDSKLTEELRRRQPRSSSNSSKSCNKCGRTHPPRKCPAFGKECRKCHKLNHFEKWCLSEKTQKKDRKDRRNKKRLHEATAEAAASSDESTFSEYETS